MPSTVLLGAQWGDEGKGKITDLIAKDYDYVVRIRLSRAIRSLPFTSSLLELCTITSRRSSAMVA